MPLWTWAFAFLLCASPSRAVTLALTDAEIKAATSAGADMVDPNNGYRVKDYVAYEVPDSRDIKPEWGDVDAVVLETPYERIRHAAYIAGRVGHTMDATQARRLSDACPNCVSVIVYAHGSNEDDETFATKFGPAVLDFSGTSVSAGRSVHSTPTEGSYPLADSNRERKVATVTYPFDFSKKQILREKQAELRFTDPTGKAFVISVNLAKYK